VQRFRGGDEVAFKLSWPNRITFLRILLIPGLVLALLEVREGEPSFRWVALGLCVLVAGGDALDGYLARKLQSRSRLGAFLDPLADKLLMTSGYLVMTSIFWPEPRIPKWVVVVVISRDVLIALFYFSFVALGMSFKQITPSLVGKGCTMFQMVTLLVVLAGPAAELLLGEHAAGMLLNGLFLMTVFMTLVSGIDYLYAARLYLISPDRVALIESDSRGRADAPKP
jgi:cardiolipin synthase (CMP-forming)